MRSNEIKAMQEVVDFQAHTVFHPCLPTCSEKEEIAEIRESKHMLEEKFDLDVYAIAYPNGDYSDRTVEISRSSGYQCGVTVDYGYNTLASDPFRLKRLSINDTGDLNELIVKASGLWGFLKTRNGKRMDILQLSCIEELNEHPSNAALKTFIEGHPESNFSRGELFCLFPEYTGVETGVTFCAGRRSGSGFIAGNHTIQWKWSEVLVVPAHHRMGWSIGS